MHTLVAVGWIGDRKVYLDTPVEEAIRLYEQERGPLGNERQRALYGLVKVVEFERWFGAAAIWEDEG